jgi:hypothetical protein
MSSRLIALAPFVLAASSCLIGCASEGGTTKASSSTNEAEMMANWTAFMTPGPEHKLLESKVGNWNTHMKWWMAPGTPAQESDGTSEVTWVMGGRYLHEAAHGSAMGQPFEGAGVTGYDNLKKKYVGGWIDNMGTGVTMSEGTYNPSTKAFTYTSSGPDAMVTKYVPLRFVETMVDANSRKIDWYGPDANGKEFKMMELTYTRAK